MGIAIYAVSKAFAEIASIKDLNMKTALVAGGIMVVIAGALVASSFILKHMQSIDIFAAFSLILVGRKLLWKTLYWNLNLRWIPFIF